MPSPLETLQKRFVRSVVFMPDPAFVGSVTGGGKLTAREAVEVYARGYVARLTEALGETYEACWRVLGDEHFQALCRDYIARFPSLSYNLSDYGADMPAFMTGRDFGLEVPFLPDLARYEWEFKELFHAAPAAGLDPAALAGRVKDESRLVFHPASRLLELGHRVYGIWKRDRADETPLERSDWEGEQRLVLYKKEGNDVHVRVLSATEHAALSALRAGRPLGEALESAPGMDETVAARLFAFVADAGLIGDVR